MISCSRNSLLSLNELILRWPKSKFLICFLRKSPTLAKLSISLSVATKSSDASVFTVLYPHYFGPYDTFTNLEYLKGLKRFH